MIVIKVAGTDITADCLIQKCGFVSLTNGTPGTCTITVRATTIRTFVLGSRIELLINGMRIWDGYLMQIDYAYPFPAQPPDSPRLYVLHGVDVNILFQKRIVFNPQSPTSMDGPLFGANTPDTTAISTLVNSWLDLSSDGLDTSSGVVGVATINEDQSARPFSASHTFGQAMAQISTLTGAVWYIDPDRVLRYADVDVADAPFELSDMPTGSQVGYREAKIVSDGTVLVNDRFDWGAGQGSSKMVFARTQDAASIAAHGRWQEAALHTAVWKQATINRIGQSVVYGSPSNRRGHKDDRLVVECTVLAPGLRAGMKARFISNAFGIDQVLPIRRMAIEFPTPTDAVYRLTLSHEIDGAWASIDPFRVNMPRIRPPRLRRLIPPIGLPRLNPAPGQPYTYVIDDFSRAGPEIEEPYQGTQWKWSAAYGKSVILWQNAYGAPLDSRIVPANIVDGQHPDPDLDTASVFPSGVWDTGSWYRGYYILLGAAVPVYEVTIIGSIVATASGSETFYLDLGTGEIILTTADNEDTPRRNWQPTYGNLALRQVHYVPPAPITTSVIKVYDRWTQTGLAFHGDFPIVEVLVRSAGLVEGWGTATIGTKWTHVTSVHSYTWALHPTEDRPIFDRPAELTTWDVGFAHVERNGASLYSSLQIPPLGADTTRFVLSAKVWAKGGNNLTRLEVWANLAGLSPYARASISTAGGGTVGVEMSNGQTSSSASAGTSFAGTTWQRLELDCTIATNTATAKFYNASDVLIGQVSLSTPAGTLNGLKSSSTLFVRVYQAGGGISPPQDLAVDDITMAEYIGDYDTPELGHFCRTFQGGQASYSMGTRFAPGSAEAWVNGVMQTDFIEDPENGTVTLGFTPASSDWVRVCVLAMPLWQANPVYTWGPWGPKLV